MYIPTREERYSKAARVTLMLCIIAPSGVVAWLYACNDLLFSLSAFLWPLSLPMIYAGVPGGAAHIFSAVVQVLVFLWLVRSPRLTPKARLTFAITWGMLFALLLRILIAYEIWRQVTGR